MNGALPNLLNLHRHRFHKEQGQALVYLLVLLPILVTLGGVTIRSGETLLVHQRLQNHCNEKSLNAAAEQAKGLQALGKLNPIARKVIDMRRKIDKALAAEAIAPALIPAFITAETSLRGYQTMIAAQQKVITEASLARALALEKRSLQNDGPGDKSEVFGPNNLLSPHRSKSSLLLHVRDEEKYLGEIGAPKTPDSDFDSRQRVWGQISVQTESFLDRWPGFKKSPPMAITCEAKVNMNSLEEKWNVGLTNSSVKGLSKHF